MNNFLIFKHAPRQQKYNRANNSNYITKALRKEIINLLRKTKRDYFTNLDTKIMKDNRKFWETVNPLF